jgi:D-galactonate transporter
LGTSPSPAFEKATYDKVSRRIIPLLFVCYMAAFLDRVNVGFAKLQMASDLHFSDAVYGFGAGIFFIGYFLFEVPSNVILARVGAKSWIARIMITWGLLSSALMLVETEFWFYALRFLLGVAEAGFFPGIILYLTYWFPASRRAHMTAAFMTAITISNALGSPISGAIMQSFDGWNGWRGWQWLFLLEGIPSVVLGFAVLMWLDDGPRQARWLATEERELVLRRLAADEASKQGPDHKRHFLDVFRDLRVWALAVVYFCGLLGFYAVTFWMPTIIQELGVDPKDFLAVGLLGMIPWGVAALSMVLVGRHSDRTGERRWHAAGSLLVAVVGLLALAMIGHAPAASILALTLVTSGTASWAATFWSFPTAFLSGTAAAAGIAWINSIGNLGGHFGPDLIGRIRTTTNSTEAAFFTLAAIAFVGAVIILILPRTPAARESPGS